MSTIKLQRWAKPLLTPCRYKVLYGGRGGGKSIAVGDVLLIQSAAQPLTVVCGREFQNSIKDSVHSLLSARIDHWGLGDYFTRGRDFIRGTNGSEFVFVGLRHNIESIKSMYGVNRLWIEEAQTLSRESWEIIKPTIREPQSEIWATLNPKNEDDPIYADLIASPDDDSFVKKVGWQDNIYFPEELDVERQKMQRTNPDLYRHIWEGECLTHTDAQVFYGKWGVQSFGLEDSDIILQGLDFGYAQDPTAGVQCFVRDDVLYIVNEMFQTKLDIDYTGEACEQKLPSFKRHVVTADSARPETIAYMKRQGYRIKGAKKGKGSIEDGIAFIRSFERVVIHPRCKHIIEEFSLYSYKTDSRTGQILDKVVDAHNHGIDALRYALEDMMKGKRRTQTKIINQYKGGLYGDF